MRARAHGSCRSHLVAVLASLAMLACQAPHERAGSPSEAGTGGYELAEFPPPIPTGSGNPPAPPWHLVSPPQPAAERACGWQTHSVLNVENDAIVERVSYRSGALTIHGEVCRPTADGPVPVTFWNHGGMEGLHGGDRALCRQLASNLGVAVFMSEYRGEGDSEGDVEVCLGEVDDVLTMLSCADHLTYVDATRKTMLGMSHGGCITTRAVQRGADVDIAVAAFGVADWAALHAAWIASEPDATPGIAAMLRDVRELVEGIAGGPPASNPDAYRIRSPLHYANQLEAFPGTLLIVHGTGDLMVPVTEACALSAAVPGTVGRFLTLSGAHESAGPKACRASGLSWHTGELPSVMQPGERHLVVVEGAGHRLDRNPAEQAMGQLAFRFARYEGPATAGSASVATRVRP